MEHGPSLVNVFLLIVTAWVAANLASQFMIQVEPAPLDAVTVVSPPAKPGIKTPEKTIVATHLFGTASSSESSRTKSVPVNAPTTKLNLTLRGIIASDTLSGALAIIENRNNGKQQHFSIGSPIFDLATLEEIYVDRVILSRDGQYETLRLPKESLGIIAAKTPRKRRQPSAAEYVESMRGEMKKLHKMTLEKMSHPWQYVYFETAVENGKTLGIKVTAEEEQEFLNKHGLKLGDIITGINGNSLEGGYGIAKAMRVLTDDDIAAIDFTIKRGEQILSVHVDKKSE